jgi:hypothetical protein
VAGSPDPAGEGEICGRGPAVSFDEEALSLVVLVAMLGEAVPTGVGPAAAAASGEAGGDSVYTEPRAMLTSVFSGMVLTEILAKARADLTERVRLLLLTRSWSGSLR